MCVVAAPSCSKTCLPYIGHACAAVGVSRCGASISRHVIHPLARMQVWGCLGAARLQLVLPKSPVDPAGKAAVKLRLLEEKRARLEAERRVRALQADLSPGSICGGAAAARECEAALARLERRAAKLRKKVRSR